VINAHPRLGAPAKQLSQQSLKEQGVKSTDHVEQDPQRKAALAQLGALNAEYERKFGFRFVVWVAGRPLDAIVPVIKQRMENPREQELKTGLSEMMAIAGDRLRKFKASQPDL